LFSFPVLNSLLAKDGVTIGQFGLFLLLAYAAGHLLAAVGNAIESALWRLAGGMPSAWITHERTSLLNPAQIEALAAKARSRLGATLERITGTPRTVWFPISRQMYADVAKNGKPERIDTFNGNYGLNRGLAAAMCGLALISFAQGRHTWGFGLLGLAVVYLYRAYRFAKHYARELYIQFLVLGDPQSDAAADKQTTP
jgi:hypothetical protein